MRPANLGLLSEVGGTLFIDDLDRFNQRLYRRLVRENRYMPSATRVKGQLAIRPCYISARHEHAQAVGLLEAVLRIGDELRQGRA